MQNRNRNADTRSGQPKGRRAGLCRSLVRAVLWLALFFFLSDNLTYLIFGNNWARNYMSDPECLWTNTPGRRCSYEDPEAVETVDDEGLRISRPLMLRRSSRCKVLFIGCSYTFGVGVSDKETYVWRLNELLPDIECVNGGVPGYGALRCGLRLRRLLARHHYDLVVYPALADHPPRDVYPMYRRFDPDAFLMPYTELRLRRDFIYHPPFALVWWGDRYYGPINMLKKSYISYLGNEVMPRPTEAEIPYIYAHQVNDMALRAAQSGARFAVLKLDRITAANSRFPEAQAWFSEHVGAVRDAAFPHEITERYRVGGVRDHHPNAEVHEYWARTIAEWLRSAPLLDFRSGKAEGR